MTNEFRHQESIETLMEVDRLTESISRIVAEHSEYEVDCFDPNRVLPLMTCMPERDPVDAAEPLVRKLLKGATEHVRRTVFHSLCRQTEHLSTAIHTAHAFFNDDACEEFREDITAKIQTLSSKYVRLVLARRILGRIVDSLPVA